jgi:hypothetical protein
VGRVADEGAARGVTPTGPWRLLSLAPAPIERVRDWFAGIDDLTIEVPPERTAVAVLGAIGAADIVISDWSNALRIDAREVAAADRLSFVMSPSVGLDNLDLAALTEAGVVVANTAGLNAASVVRGGADWSSATPNVPPNVPLPGGLPEGSAPHR